MVGFTQFINKFYIFVGSIQSNVWFYAIPQLVLHDPIDGFVQSNCWFYSIPNSWFCPVRFFEI